MSIYCILNAEREYYGLKPLRWNRRLLTAAQGMGTDMVTRQFFAHDEPDGVGLAARVEVTGYLPKTNDDWSLGENLGWGEGARSTPKSIVFGWMTSPGHRVNMLDPAFQEIGIACVMGSPFANHPGGAIFVAEFGHARPDRKAPAKKPSGSKKLSTAKRPATRRQAAARKPAAATKPADARKPAASPVAGAEQKATKLQPHR